MEGNGKTGRVAIPVQDGKLSMHFGQSHLFFIYDVREGKITGKEEVIPPEHGPEVYPRWLAELGVTDVITGGIGQKAIDVFLREKINVFDGAPEKEAGELVNDYLSGDLESLGNYCDH
jgi:predicted Fe-Mo cluster-binding NifX family protein